MRNTANAPNDSSQINFAFGPAVANDVRAAVSGFVKDGGAGNLIFKTLNWSSYLTEKMRIDENGNVGIGTTNPSSTLAVNGDVNTGGGGVKWKTYSGTTSSSAGTTFTHGLDATKIISVQCSIYASSEGYFYNMTYTIPGILDARTRWNSANINIMNDYSTTFNQSYRCIAIYIP